MDECQQQLQQQQRKDFHNRNLEVIAQLRQRKVQESVEREEKVKRKQDLQSKLKQRYIKEEVIQKQVSLPSIKTPESKQRESTAKMEDQGDRKTRMLEKQRQYEYLEQIRTKQQLEQQKRSEEQLRQQQIKNSVRSKVLQQLQDVQQYATKDDLIDNQDSESDEEAQSQKKVIKKYPFITDYKIWKKKQRLDDSVKVYIIIGGYGDISKALQSRGWVKNPDQGSPCYDFKFTLHNSEIEYNQLADFQMVNHFAKIICLTTKAGLCRSLNNLVWFNNVDKNIFFPRAYDLSDEDDYLNFKEEFQKSKAESILKMYIHLFKKKNTVLMGKMKSQVQVALEVCQRMLLDINEIIDMKKQPPVVSEKEWELMAKNDLNVEALAQKKHLAWLQKISDKKVVKKKKKGKQDKQEEQENEEIDEFTQQVLDVLQQFKNKYPQYYLNGVENIWIVKPAGSSRGRGIQCYKNLVEIEDHVVSKGAQWVVQKYIEKPLIVVGKKMDIRQWVLVTNWSPLTVWIYDECYLRFSAEDYDTTELDNRMIHLTNNSVQKKGEHFNNSEIEGNMWSQEQFTEYIKTTHSVDFQEQIRPQIDQIAVWTLQSAQDLVDIRKNSYEMFGYDYMIDDKFHVWLIEVNSSPDFSYSTSVTERLVKEVSEDLIKVVVDRQSNKKCDTGKFRRIHKGKSILDKPISVGLNLCLEGKQIKKVRG